MFFFLTLHLLCLSTFPAHSQASLRFSYQHYIGKNGDTLLYRQLLPDSDPYRKYPMVIFLHGSGERGHDNEAQLQWGVMNFATDRNLMLHPALVIVPQCPERMSWSSFTRGEQLKLDPTPSEPMELLISLIHKLIKTIPVDSTRIYITGLSMGGYGTYDAIERYPDLFAAAVPVCGGGDVSKAAEIAHIPIWIFHGADDPAVSTRYDHAMLEALTMAGARPGFTQYPEVGHFSWIQAYTDPMMMEWLFQQHK